MINELTPLLDWRGLPLDMASLTALAMGLGWASGLRLYARFDMATDRSVQGSLLVAKQDLEAWLYEVPNVMDLDPLKVACWLNDRPATVYGKWVWPKTAMVEAVAGL